MSQLNDCCLKGFNWDGKPEGHESTLAQIHTYVVGSSNDIAIMIIHDLLGWTFPNLRLLTDHYAKETGATAYLPDFFCGEVLPAEILSDTSRWGELDIHGFTARHSKDNRKSDIFNFAKTLRARYKRVAAIGFCYGGWAVFQLGAKGVNLVDCISVAHPSWLTKEEIDCVGVPVQIMAPEFDPVYTAELREHSNRVIPTLGVPYDFQWFPGVEHAFATRGNPENEKERLAMVRAKNSAVHWFKQWLYESEK